MINEYFGFLDNKGDFFLITGNDNIILMDDCLLAFNLNNEHGSIEEFLDSEFDATLVQVYKQNDFDITIDLK